MNKDALRSAIKLVLVFLTILVFLLTWLTGQLGNPQNLTLIIILAMATMAAFFVLNALERRERSKRRERQESIKRPATAPGDKHQRRSDVSFSLKEKKSGLTWGGGNIKASTATRGTKRKFLGK
jgi:ABC-type transport system involved in cytochrome bd biosynthesis fused ATPase/permease subunit